MFQTFDFKQMPTRLNFKAVFGFQVPDQGHTFGRVGGSSPKFLSPKIAEKGRSFPVLLCKTLPPTPPSGVFQFSQSSSEPHSPVCSRGGSPHVPDFPEHFLSKKFSCGAKGLALFLCPQAFPCSYGPHPASELCFLPCQKPSLDQMGVKYDALGLGVSPEVPTPEG